MSIQRCIFGLVSFLPALAACDGGTSGSGGSGGAGGGGGAGGTGGSAQECFLVDDPGGPGQYSDTCVNKEWAEPYAGTYSSASCELTITVPAGGAPAVFELVLTDAALGGTYTHDWEGGPAGPGNDSYYRFTTDASFATTKAINFGVGQKVSDTEERSIRFRINDLETGTPSYTGGFAKTISSPFSNTEADCGVLVPGP